MKITHLGHSCLLIETGGARLLVDPGAFSSGFEELTGLDAVLITHAHPDHVDVERLPALMEADDGAALVVEPSLAAQLGDLGARALHPGGSFTAGGATVEAVGGEHAEIHPDVPRVGNVGLLVRADGEPTLLHPGDSYATAPGGVDVLALPVNAPWARSAATADFLRAVAPPVAFTAHDALLSAAGRAVYLGNLSSLAPEGTRLVDTGGSGPVDLSDLA